MVPWHCCLVPHMCVDEILTCHACCTHSAGCGAVPGHVVNCLVSMAMTWKVCFAAAAAADLIVSVQDTRKD